MVYEDIEHNKRNTFLLIFFFLLVITGLGWVIGEIYGEPVTAVAAAAIFAAVSTFTSYFFSDKIVIAVTGAVPADEKHYRQYHISAEGMALAAGIPKPKLYILAGDSINAFATGRDPRHSAIAVTEGALRKLDKVELEAVIGHEMSHIKNYDILVSTVAAVLVGMTVIISDMITRSMFRSSIRRSAGRKGAVLIVIAIAAAILAPLAGTIIKMAISRQREYLADGQAVLLTRFPAGLISALEKIRQDAAAPAEVNRGLAHMYLSVPPSMLSDNLFATHPPLENRIERLKKHMEIKA